LARRGALVFALDTAYAPASAGTGESTARTTANSSTPPPVHNLSCDVTDPGAVREAMRVAASDTDVIDVLILAAGRFPNRPLEEWNLDQFEDLWRLNVGGVFTAVQAALPYLRRSDAGRVVEISSSAVHQAVPGFAPYAATKAALIGFARAMAAELSNDGVTVNAVTPGLTATHAALSGDVAPFFDAVVADQLIKRPLAADDLVGGVLYLCSPSAAMVTGQVLNIDGGAVTY
jgi:3-oxoacyl-[acyl-carrier protein] reductase